MEEKKDNCCATAQADEITRPEKAWIHCLKVEATVKTKKKLGKACRINMNRRHDSHLLHFGRTLGFKVLLADIRTHNFRFLDYFYRSGGGDYSVWLQKAREKEISERKALEEAERLAEPREKTSWDAEGELKRLQEEHGLRSPEAAAFAGKWGLVIS